MSLYARLTASLFIGFLIVGFTVAALLPTVLQVFWTSMPYLALTVLLAVIIRSPFFAVGGTIVYGTAVERLIPVLSAGAAHFEGTCSGAPTRGNGYVELPGYAGNLPLP